jgi:hypothetical protein
METQRLPHGPSATAFCLMKMIIEQEGECSRSEDEILSLYKRCAAAVREAHNPPVDIVQSL